MNRRSLFLIIILVMVSAVSIAVFPFAGPLDIQVDSIFSDNMMSRVFWYLRFPRVAGAFLAGAVLAVAGMMFQSLFRNDLATPYTLGVSSGAALGAVLAIKIYSGLVPSLPV
ncbi:MAG TPA: iron chelate uptake ABC transporter family permease subunit, partial [bacterium]|nr:iron chelate uptake ABC transporter family permease subunit [bacterium]